MFCAFSLRSLVKTINCISAWSVSFAWLPCVRTTYTAHRSHVQIMHSYWNYLFKTIAHTQHAHMFAVGCNCVSVIMNSTVYRDYIALQLCRDQQCRLLCISPRVYSKWSSNKLEWIHMQSSLSSQQSTFHLCVCSARKKPNANITEQRACWHTHSQMQSNKSIWILLFRRTQNTLTHSHTQTSIRLIFTSIHFIFSIAIS